MQTRHTKILSKLDTSWTKYGQEDFSDSKETLFRENFELAFTEKVEKEVALAKAVVASKCSKEARVKEIPSSLHKENGDYNQFF